MVNSLVSVTKTNKLGKGCSEYPSGAGNVDFNTSPTEHTAEHHITQAVSELTMEYDIMPANSGLMSDDVWL